MSGEPVLFTVEVAPGLPGSIPVVLKKVMDMPPPNILDGDDDTDKEKLGLGDAVTLGGGGSEMGPSAALTPAIWEKTIPYDGENFHLEYMDLEEFLMENGIAGVSDEDSNLFEEVSKTPTKPKAAQKAVVKATAPLTLLPIKDLDGCEEEVITSNESDISAEVTAESDTETPDSPEPDEIVVNMSYEPDPTDLVLSSVPGGELFDPRKHKFSEDDLKPQPMIKKAKKVFVPEEQKDDKYWQRRKKNNVAAKRSRDARRLKENQITVRAAFLERENTALRTEVAELRKESNRYKSLVTRYQAKFGPL